MARRNTKARGTVETSGRADPVINQRKKKRILLTRINSMRGAGQGAPVSDSMNVFPFPFQGTWQPARHGHHPVFHAGAQRRVGAWRYGVGLGVPSAQRKSGTQKGGR